MRRLSFAAIAAIGVGLFTIISTPRAQARGMTCQMLFTALPAVSPSSYWIARHVIGLELLTTDQVRLLADFIYPLKARFARLPKDARLYVLRRDQELTDIEPFSPLKDLTLGEVIPSQAGTAWGDRLHNKCRGYSWGCQIAVGLEQFKTIRVGEKHIAIHELAHLLHNHMSPSERVTVSRLFANATAHDLFMDHYSRLNENEYFAEALETFYAETRDHRLVDPAYHGQTIHTLIQRDPKMYRFIHKILYENILQPKRS